MTAGLNLYIRVGSMEFRRSAEVRVLSERHRPLTRMSISVPDPTGNIYRAVDNGAGVSLIFGYRDQVTAMWEGTVKGTRLDPDKTQLVISCIGRDRPLDDTLVTQSFHEESPENIVKFALARAGMTAGQIEPTGITIPRFTASTIPVWQVARQCEHTMARAFGIDTRKWALWRGRDGKVNWGPGDESGDIPVIDGTANLIRHCPVEGAPGLNAIETFLLPDLMHSRRFRIADQRRGIEGEFRAIKVEHVVREASARTLIGYGEEYERY